MKGGKLVIILTILILMLFILTVFTIIALSVGGAAFIVIFGDVIVCILALVLFIRFLIKRKRNRRGS